MSTNTNIPATENEGWGFWGTMGGHASIAWPLACIAISKATGQPLESIRPFLDSRHGRHFADDVQNELYAGKTLQDAINAATTRWMGWKISKSSERTHGIPSRMPYLTGFVIHCAIIDEQEAA